MEIFLQEASERLQFLREYSGILQDAYPRQEDVERLHIAAHTLAGTSASYGFPLFAEISGKLAHIFQYAMNATIAADAAGPLVEFISEAVALLESDLIMISTNGVESGEDIGVFKQRYPFAFQTSAVAAAGRTATAEDCGTVLLTRLRKSQIQFWKHRLRQLQKFLTSRCRPMVKFLPKFWNSLYLKRKSICRL